MHPYPDAEPAPPPKAFFAFLWAGTRGLRPYLLALTVLSAGIGAFEALLFSMMGSIVDWLGKVEPSQLW
ncbi:MAG: multidrug ABC transporter ATP-binding protein, partial [Rhizobacter sp.]|nr:multidrug ABC transporter ATP-binding protein [Rhizobacter sp.]